MSFYAPRKKRHFGRDLSPSRAVKQPETPKRPSTQRGDVPRRTPGPRFDVPRRTSSQNIPRNQPEMATMFHTEQQHSVGPAVIHITSAGGRSGEPNGSDAASHGPTLDVARYRHRSAPAGVSPVARRSASLSRRNMPGLPAADRLDVLDDVDVHLASRRRAIGVVAVAYRSWSGESAVSGLSVFCSWAWYSRQTSLRETLPSASTNHHHQPFDSRARTALAAPLGVP